MSRILLVDDEPHVLAGLQRVLRREHPDFDCENVTSAPAALERAGRGDIDVIVSDIRMPGMDGIDLLTRLKGDPATQHIPVIVLTGTSEAETRRLALQLGAYDFVSKPADSHELTARLGNALRLKFYEDQLRSQNDTLEQQVFQLQKLEVIGILAGGVAHDLNSILGSIGGNTELAVNGMEDHAFAQEHLQRVLESVEHATKLVQQILILGRNPESVRQACDLGALIDDCLKLLRVSVPKGISIDQSNSGGAFPLVADPTQIRQVVMNLCLNAIQAMPRGGNLRVSVTETQLDANEAAEIGGVTSGGYLKLGVADTGTGMDEATRARVFETFFTTKNPGHGTGLGLPVTDRIVWNHGGAITVESAPGTGTTFCVFFPIARVPGREIVQGMTGAEHAREETHSVR